ncbi:MAG: carbohydrate ABC transporter permease [Eubacterium sp.]|nr:carbohydrate ABC transporter permease [Eubacterium sp.]
MAKEIRKLEHTSALQRANANPDMKVGPGLLIHRIVCYIVLTFFSVLCLFFFYILIINATRGHTDISKGFSLLPGGVFLTNFQSAISNTTIPVLNGILNSLIIATLSAIFSIYFSAMTAYAIHVYDFKGKKFLFNFILLIMTIPTQLSALGLFRMSTDWGMRDTFIPLIVPAIAAPTVFFFMIQYMKSSLPLDIVEAARIDGSGEFRTFNTIVLPILKPALAVQAIFSFVSSWNNFFVPSLILDSASKKTLPIMISQLRGADFLKFDLGQVYMFIFIAIVPVMIVYFCLSKFIIAGVAVGGVKE